MIELLLIAHLFLATITTFVVFRLDYSDRRQAILQSLLAWCLPLIGAMVVLAFQSVVHRNMTTKMKPDSPNLNDDKYNHADSLFHEINSGD